MSKEIVEKTEEELELEEYREAIEFLSSKAEDFSYENKGASHAVIVLENMLKTTEKEFLMFSEKLDSKVADEEVFLEVLEEYLKKGLGFQLLLEKMPETEERSKALVMVLDYETKNSNIKVKVAKEEFLQMMRDISSDHEMLHFAVSDEKSYRIETDIKLYKAVCNFNGIDTAVALRNIFKDNFKH